MFAYCQCPLKMKMMSAPTATTSVLQNRIFCILAKIFSSEFVRKYQITKITIGENIVSIGKNAFYGCKKLKTITIRSKKLTSKTVSKNAFKGLTRITTIKVPKNKLTAYKKLLKKKGLSSKVKVKGYK